MNIVKIPNQIIRQPLEKLTLSKIDGIALHHMAHPTAGVKDVEKWHVNPPNSWRAIGYNYWIGFDGTVYEGRGLNLGAGVGNHNGHLISVGFQGDFDAKPVQMTQPQFQSGVELIRWLKGQIPTIKTVDGHKRWSATACPGKYFPLAAMVEAAKQPTAPVTMTREQCRGIIQGRCGFDKPGDVWRVIETHPFPDAVYEKLARGMT